MSSPRYGTPLRLRVEHSPRLRMIFIFFISLCVVALALVQMPLWTKILSVLVLIVVALRTWRSRPELGGEACELVLRPNGGWLLQEEKLKLLGESTVSYGVMVLGFSGNGGGRWFVLWRKEVDGEVWRRLGVYLGLYSSETEL
ncbi:MAG: hypothetical protein OEZ16_04055 [Chromatiales bacterium]|nr:hypothetical protein [Chromatiales bacterium]